MAKKTATANFCENCKNHDIDMAWHQITVYKTQHLVLTAITTCSAKFSCVKFCRCRTLKYIFSRTTLQSHIEPVSNKAHGLW